MRVFLKKSVLFLLPPLLFLLAIELLLPPTVFTFRIWEAIKVKKHRYFIGPFYPNVAYSMTEEGDLAHHTTYAVKKKVTWRTDALGFRNDHYNPKPDIVLIGDSNIAGTSLSQKGTLAILLSQYTGLSVYSLAPANINVFIGLKNENMMQTPQFVVLSSIERKIPSLPSSNSGQKLKYPHIRLNPFVLFFTVPLDKLIRMNSQNYLTSRINHSVGRGIQSTKDERMFFLQGRESVIEPKDSILESTGERIKSYQRYCDSIGVRFIFFPIPNKETIFWELAGLDKQPLFLSALHKRLLNSGIMTIETVRLFNKLKNNGIIPYHYDDGHWNQYGVEAVAQEIARLPVFFKD